MRSNITLRYRVQRLALLLPLAIASPAIATGSDTSLASVNGSEITREQVAAFRERHEGIGDQQAVGELIARELFYQDALKHQLEQQPALQQRLAELQRELLIGAAIERAMALEPIDEAQLQQRYERLKPQLVEQEYHARHILVESEAEAQQLIAALARGEDFATLAKAHSTGPTGEKGGDLGWFSARQMVAPFSAAVAQLEPGNYTKAPVQTQFGWHVIRLEARRSTTPPSFADLREKLEQMAQRQQMANYLDQLRSSAQVVRHDRADETPSAQ